eukprot:scaffold14794_cov96-Isochrysis_galbana.AAC.4
MLVLDGPLAGWLAAGDLMGVNVKLGTVVPPGELSNEVTGANVKDASPDGAAGAAGAATGARMDPKPEAGEAAAGAAADRSSTT